MQLAHISLLLSSVVGLTLADRSDLPTGYNIQGTLQGCSEVDCPDDGNCQIEGKTFTKVGVTNFTSDLSSYPLNWAIGTRVYDTDSDKTGTQQAFEKEFFLGTAEDFDLGAAWLGGCALFFTQEKISFSSDNEEISEGTCSDALGSDCVDALRNQAIQAVQKMNVRNITLEKACSNLQDVFMDQDIARDCQLSNRTQWTSVKSAGFTGDSVSYIIQKGDNTNCLPASPESNSLRDVFGYNVTDLGEIRGNTAAKLFNVVPVMTVFFPNSSTNDTKITEPEAHLSCLKPTGFNELELANLDSGSPDDNEGGAGRFEAPRAALLGLLIPFLMVIFA